MLLNKNSKYGVTLAEIMTAIAIVGAIAAIAMIVFTKSMPSKEEEIHKKISYLVEQIAVQMYDNETFYPRTNDVTKQGFLNTDEVSVDGVKYGGSTENAKKEKFCKLFARQFNSINSDVTCLDDINTGNPSFRSVDGVDWWLPKTTFLESANGQVKGYAKIKVDVNGYDKGRNCAEGSTGCSSPDTFFYYIKANGSVTLSNPTAIDDRSYTIIPQIVTKDGDGNIIESVSNNIVEIAPIDSSTGLPGEYSSDEEDFKDLVVNKSYMLRAKPATGYISNWATKETANEAEKRYGYKKVRISKINTDVPLEFRQIKTYCIKLKVDCSESSINDCVSTKQYKYNCKYVLKEGNQGDYKRVSDYLDNYDFVGPFNGSYKFECSNNGNLSPGTGADDGYLTVCGLEPGDYQLYVVPKAGKYIKPRITENEYVQNVRLGTSDLTDFVVEIGEE